VAADDLDGVHGVEVVLLRQISASVAELTKDMRDVRERLVRIESQGAIERIERLEKALETLSGRIGGLESDRDRRTGMTNLSEWVIRSAPWLFALLLGAAVYLAKGSVK